MGYLDLRERNILAVMQTSGLECPALSFLSAILEPYRVVHVVIDASIELYRCVGRVDVTIDVGQKALDLGGTPVSTKAKFAPALLLGIVDLLYNLLEFRQFGWVRLDDEKAALDSPLGSVDSDAGTLCVITGVGKCNVVAVQTVGLIMYSLLFLFIIIVLDLDWSRWFPSEHHIKDLGEWLQDQNVRIEMDTDGFRDCVGV